MKEQRRQDTQNRMALSDQIRTHGWRERQTARAHQRRQQGSSSSSGSSKGCGPAMPMRRPATGRAWQHPRRLADGQADLSLPQQAQAGPRETLLHNLAQQHHLKEQQMRLQRQQDGLQQQRARLQQHMSAPTVPRSRGGHADVSREPGQQQCSCGSARGGGCGRGGSGAGGGGAGTRRTRGGHGHVYDRVTFDYDTATALSPAKQQQRGHQLAVAAAIGARTGNGRQMAVVVTPRGGSVFASRGAAAYGHGGHGGSGMTGAPFASPLRARERPRTGGVATPRTSGGEYSTGGHGGGYGHGYSDDGRPYTAESGC